MQKEFPTTYKVGSIREFAEWTKQVVRDPARAEGVPKNWFDSEETARKSKLDQVSAEAMVKLLSPGNLTVLAMICQQRPESLRALAAVTGRKEASLSRTLKRFAELGIIAFEDGPHRTRVPTLVATRVHLDIDLTGHHSAVAVEGPK
jgi:predicted transcriptional regulator